MFVTKYIASLIDHVYTTNPSHVVNLVIFSLWLPKNMPANIYLSQSWLQLYMKGMDSVNDTVAELLPESDDSCRCVNSNWEINQYGSIIH